VNIADIMTREVISIGSSERLGAAVELLHEHGIRHLPVLQGDELCGILSDRDIRKYRPPEALLEGNIVAWIALLDTPIWNVMTPEVLSVSSEDSLDRVLDFFVDLRVGAVCVVDAGRLVGIVSYIDALRALRDQRRRSANS